MLALGGRTGSGGGLPGKKCNHLRGGDRGCCAINMQPARRLRDTHWSGDCASLGGWAKPAVQAVAMQSPMVVII